MTLNNGQEALAEKIGQLLAQSPVDQKLKEMILEKIDQIPEHLLFKLLDSLELENDELERTAFEIDLFLKEQDANWEKVAEEQKKAADDAVDRVAEALS